jgi:CBS domain-containing protein
MNIKDVMSKTFVILRPHFSLKEAVDKMQALNVLVLPVCDNGDLVGMITDEDIARALRDGRSLTSTLVEDVMTREVLFCFDDQSPEDAMKIMKEKQIEWLFVITKQLVGIVSMDDVSNSEET